MVNSTYFCVRGCGSISKQLNLKKENTILTILKLKAGTNRTTCWPTFRLTSPDQHVGPVCFGHKHVEGKNKGKMLANISYFFFCKNGLKWLVGAVCGASQHVGQHRIWIRMFFYDSNVEIVEFWMFFYKDDTCWCDLLTNVLSGLRQP